MDRIIIICNDINWIRMNASKSMVAVLNKPSKIMEYDIMFIDLNTLTDYVIEGIDPTKIHYIISDNTSDVETFLEVNNLEEIILFDHNTSLPDTEENSLLFTVFDWLKNEYPKMPIWLVGYPHQVGYEFNLEDHYIMKYEHTRIISKSK